MTDFDDTLASVLERLSSNLTSRDMEERALDIFLTLNGDFPGVFVEGAELRWKNRRHTTTAEDSMIGVAEALGADPVKLYLEYLVAAPLLAAEVRFVFLARVPPITISPSKISLFDTPGVPNKFNAVFVTTGSDEVSSVSLDLQFTAEAMEYGIHDVPSGEGYQASEWLTFVDFEFAQGLGEVDVPLADRQFPLPPQVLSHGVRPQVEDGKVDPTRLEEIMLLRLQPEVRLRRRGAGRDLLYPVVGEDGARDADGGEQDDSLARNLAQYQAIDAALWDDVFRLRGWNDPFPPEDQRPIVTQAVAIFAELARQVAESWGQWSYAAPEGCAASGIASSATATPTAARWSAWRRRCKRACGRSAGRSAGCRAPGSSAARSRAGFRPRWRRR